MLPDNPPEHLTAMAATVAIHATNRRRSALVAGDI